MSAYCVRLYTANDDELRFAHVLMVLSQVRAVLDASGGSIIKALPLVRRPLGLCVGRDDS
jgi:hypothetical protein